MFIIMKKTRAIENPSTDFAYRGPTCSPAGVEPGKVYKDRQSAQVDANKLGKYNGVGFVVVACNPECFPFPRQGGVTAAAPDSKSGV